VRELRVRLRGAYESQRAESESNAKVERAEGGRQMIWFRVRRKKERDVYIAFQNYVVLISINCILGKIKN
jgi:hypothetical protein